jgi:hypothetical protein
MIVRTSLVRGAYLPWIQSGTKHNEPYVLIRSKHPNQMLEQVLMMSRPNTKITMMLIPENKHLSSLIMINKSNTGLELSKAILLNKGLSKVK